MPVAVLVPVLNRPGRVTPLLDAFAATTPDAHIVFITDPDDHDERHAIATQPARPGLTVTEIVHPGGYAAKINTAVRATTEPLILLGADDLEPQPGWLDAATAHLTGPTQMVGVNDLIERPDRPEHATHFLLTRAAAELPCIDGSPGPMYEGYDHCSVDNELIATATHRGIYTYAEDAHVRHLHWMNGTAQDDATYKRGRRRFHQDRRLFRQRAAMWAA